MRILSLRAERFKRLRALDVELTEDNGLVLVEGENGAGKSSVLDAIMAALGGGRRTPDKPIQEGEEEALIKVELGTDSELEYLVVRKWTANDRSYLTVEGPEGEDLDSPQSILDSLLDELTFDPMNFMSQTAKEQREILLASIDIDVDLESIEQEREEAYEQRRKVNRRVDDLEGSLAEMDEPDPDLPDETQSFNEIVQMRDRARDKLGEREELEEELSENQEEIEVLEQRLAKLRKDNDVIRNDLDELPEEQELKDDIEEAEDRVEDIEQLNDRIREKKRYEERQSELEEHKKQANTLTAEIEQLDDIKQEVLAEADLPLDGMNITPDGIEVNGVPFDDLAMNEKIRLSINVAMNLNPELRVIRFTDGSLLDRKNLKELDHMAEQHDFQVWVERVNDSGEFEDIEAPQIIIEQGRLRRFDQ